MVSKTKAGKARNVQCPYCEKKVYSRNALIMHIAHHHGDKPNITAKKAPKLKSFKKEKEIKKDLEQPQEQVYPDEDAEDDPYG